MEQPVKVWYIVNLVMAEHVIMLCEPFLLLAAVEEGSHSQFSVVAIVLSVLGCLLLLTIIIILVLYVIVRTTKLLPVYWKRNMRSGIDNALYSTANTDPGAKFGAIDTSYPTRSSSITKSTAQFKSWSASLLEYYSSIEYTEVVDISQDMTSVSFMKNC
jgi:hypothetical protein